MKIKNINELKKSINHSTLLVFIIIFGSALFALNLTHSQFIQRRAAFNKQEVISAGSIYKSNLSEKLSIIASSTVFLDYLRSGDVTRKRLYAQFLSQMSTLKSKSISGMQLIDHSGRVIFDYGDSTSLYISLDLCYLNQTLDSDMGDCAFFWKLYFRKNDLLNEILSFNKAIKTCKSCDSYNLIDTNSFGSFPIKNHSNFNLTLTIPNEKDYFFYVYFLLMTIALTLFGAWSWYRLSSILNNYIANPINNLTNCLKVDESLESKNNIEEIQYLINEINVWKARLNKIQSDENAEMIGKIAAQLAHDVRSPLSAIDMLVRNLTSVPENYRATLRNAIQRISDIANNFLCRYKKQNSDSTESSVNNEYIPSILENIVSEKRSQYVDRNIEIRLSIDDDAWDSFSLVNSIDLKRVLSNIINNSIEAIISDGYVIIKLIKINDYLRIEIIDNGCGISSDMLPIIANGGVSIGKKDGSGLGLSHAFSRVEEWNGDIDIKSEIDIGTEIGINLPLSKFVPEWFNSFLCLSPGSIVCVLDDEHQAHSAWDARLSNAMMENLVIHHFFLPTELHKFIADYEGFEITYLIDYDLGMGLSNGIDLIEKFKINNQSILVTNRYDDVDVQGKCMSLGVKIIPKNLILHIPISGARR